MQSNSKKRCVYVNTLVKGKRTGFLKIKTNLIIWDKVEISKYNHTII